MAREGTIYAVCGWWHLPEHWAAFPVGSDELKCFHLEPKGWLAGFAGTDPWVRGEHAAYPFGVFSEIQKMTTGAAHPGHGRASRRSGGRPRGACHRRAPVDARAQRIRPAHRLRTPPVPCGRGKRPDFPQVRQSAKHQPGSARTSRNVSTPRKTRDCFSNTEKASTDANDH